MRSRAGGGSKVLWLSSRSRMRSLRAYPRAPRTSFGGYERCIPPARRSPRTRAACRPRPPPRPWGGAAPEFHLRAGPHECQPPQSHRDAHPDTPQMGRRSTELHRLRGGGEQPLPPDPTAPSDPRRDEFTTLTLLVDAALTCGRARVSGHRPEAGQIVPRSRARDLEAASRPARDGVEPPRQHPARAEEAGIGFDEARKGHEASRRLLDLNGSERGRPHRQAAPLGHRGEPD